MIEEIEAEQRGNDSDDEIRGILCKFTLCGCMKVKVDHCCIARAVLSVIMLSAIFTVLGFVI